MKNRGRHKKFFFFFFLVNLEIHANCLLASSIWSSYVGPFRWHCRVLVSWWIPCMGFEYSSTFSYEPGINPSVIVLSYFQQTTSEEYLMYPRKSRCWFTLTPTYVIFEAVK